MKYHNHNVDIVKHSKHCVCVCVCGDSRKYHVPPLWKLFFY